MGLATHYQGCQGADAQQKAVFSHAFWPSTFDLNPILLIDENDVTLQVTRVLSVEWIQKTCTTSWVVVLDKATAERLVVREFPWLLIIWDSSQRSSWWMILTWSKKNCQSKKEPMLNVERFRKDFPILNQIVQRWTSNDYLDNAATTQKPLAVLETISRYWAGQCKCSSWGSYLGGRATASMRRLIETILKDFSAVYKSSLYQRNDASCNWVARFC